MSFETMLSDHFCFVFLDKINRILIHDICSMMIVVYHQIKTPIDFLYRQDLNLKFLI